MRTAPRNKKKSKTVRRRRQPKPQHNRTRRAPVPANKRKAKNHVCDGLSFDECELSILRMAVEKSEHRTNTRQASAPEIKEIIDIVVDFLKSKNVICYGGTAINNILPKRDKFYDPATSIPDYDFFSKTALADAKELADIYYAKGFVNTEAKSGVHHGTYKVFVNFVGVADITQLDTGIFDSMQKEMITIDRIQYAPPNFLRMSMYLELSRPEGDVDRWEKVLKRLILLNKHYPVANLSCDRVKFQRAFDSEESRHLDQTMIFETVKNILIREGVVFFGGFANTLYSHYMPKNLQHQMRSIADFDVLSETPVKTVKAVRLGLQMRGVGPIHVEEHEAIGEIIPRHFEVKIGEESFLYVYEPIGCHSYNLLVKKNQKIKVATIDTMLSFYLAFLYANKPYYNAFIQRILCMSNFLFQVQQENRLAQKGLLKRFSITCYGKQPSINDIREQKMKKFQELKRQKHNPEYEAWFLNYRPETKAQKQMYKKWI